MALMDMLFAPQTFAPGAEQMGLLQRLLPMLQQVQQGPGFPMPQDVSAQAQQPVLMPRPRPQMPIAALAGPDLATIMESQGSTRPLPYPMMDGSQAASQAMPQATQMAPQAMSAPPMSGAPSGGGAPQGGFGASMGQILPLLLRVGAGAAAGAMNPQAAAANIFKDGGSQQKLAQQQMAFQMLVSQGVSPQKAMLAVMAPEAGKAVGILGGGGETEDIKNFNVARQQGFKGTFMDYLAAKRAGAGEFGLQPIWGTDEQGNPAIVQLGKSGEATQAKMPQGFKPAKDPIKIDAGTEWILLDPQTRQPVGRMPKDVAGKERQEEIGKSQGQASQIIPQVETAVNNALDVINKLRRHPGLDAGTGATGVVARQIWGSDAYNFGALNKQAQGQTFLAAREALKGAGQVTDFEGMKGEQAIANLDAAQSKQQYLEALASLEKMVRASLADLKKKAGRPAEAAPADDGGGWTVLPNGVRIREKR